MKKWFAALDKNLLTYWLALVMIFAGLALAVSVETALIVCGAIMAVVSIANSYVSSYLVIRFYQKPKDK